MSKLYSNYLWNWRAAQILFGKTIITLCPIGEYQNESSQDQCKSCSEGLSTFSVGPLSVEFCGKFKWIYAFVENFFSKREIAIVIHSDRM